MGIETELFNTSSWILKVTANYGLVYQVQITRFLIDRTIEGQTTGLYQLSLLVGTVTHYADSSPSLFVPRNIEFHIQA